jgi:hypothetical protein
LFIVNNRDYFVSINVCHNINTRRKKWFTLESGISGHVSEMSLLSCIKIFNGLPKTIKDISSKSKNFKIALKHDQIKHSF